MSQYPQSYAVIYIEEGEEVEVTAAIYMTTKIANTAKTTSFFLRILGLTGAGRIS